MGPENRNMIKAYISAFVILQIALISCSTDKADFYIPDNFIGNVSIIYDTIAGQNIELQKGRKRYIIPPSGTLLVNEMYESSYMDYNYYYCNDDYEVTRELIPSYEQRIDSSKDAILREGVVGHGYFDSDTVKNTFCTSSLIQLKTKALILFRLRGRKLYILMRIR